MDEEIKKTKPYCVEINYFCGGTWQQSGKTAKKAYMTDLLNALIQEGKQVKAIHFNNGWIEFDTNEDYEKACEWEESGKLKNLICLTK